MTRILILVGHPDPAPGRFCRALAAAYARGARDAGHEVREVDIATLEFPMLRSREDFEHGTPPPAIARAQQDFAWAGHVVLVFPLWLGTMPALVKALLEQVMRPGFAFRYREGGMPEKLMKGKSARMVVTMGMPGFLYAWLYRAHGVKGLARNILGFVGFAPVRHTYVGMVEGGEKRAAAWLAQMERLGAKAG